MNALLNLDLLWVGLAVAGAGTLGCSIYFSAQKNATSQAFLFFAIASILWGVANFASARAVSPDALLWLIRLVLFCAAWFVFALLVLARQFPDERPNMSRLWFVGLLSWTAAMSILVLTPLVFVSVTAVLPRVQTTTGPGIVLFGATVFAYVGAAVWILRQKLHNASGELRRQIEFVLAGLAVSFIFLVIFEFVFPAFLNDPTFVPFGGLFLLPFIFGTAYAILRYRLFEPRVAFFGLLTFLLATATFFDILISDSLGLVLYRTLELGFVLAAGVWLIRSMVREFELERELAETNARQEGLIHFIGHEVKGFLTKAEGAFAALGDGDFGALPEPLKPFVAEALKETRNGVTSVSDILKAANQKKGTVAYEKAPFDLKTLVAEAVEKARPTAVGKGLSFAFVVDESQSYSLVGDKVQITDHVLRNLIDNAINYTPTGSVEVSLKKELGRYVFAVKDSGVGISDEDKKHLFTEGGHGKESQKVNAHSTGYGLFIAKNVTEAHGGTIRAESGGSEKGSTFVVELPIESGTVSTLPAVA